MCVALPRRGALCGIRDRHGDDRVGCRRRRHRQRRKRGVVRKLRLIGLVCVVVVVGVALTLVRVCSVVQWRGAAVATGEMMNAGGGERERLAVSMISVSNGNGGRERRLEDDSEEEVDANASEACLENNYADGGVGRVVLLVIAILFTFNGLAIVCDEFFQASLEKISEVRVRILL